MSSPIYYLTIDEMAALLRVSRKIIRGMIVRAEIPFIKVGKQIRIHVDVLKMFEGDAAKEKAERQAEYASRIEAMHAAAPHGRMKMEDRDAQKAAKNARNRARYHAQKLLEATGDED